MSTNNKWFEIIQKEIEGVSKWGIEAPKNYIGSRDVSSNDIMVPFKYESIQIVKADPNSNKDWCIRDIFVGTRLLDGEKVYDAYKPWVSGGPPVSYYFFGFDCLKEDLPEFPTYESLVKEKGK